MGVDLYAGATDPAGIRAIGVLALFAIERLRKAHGGKALSDSFIAMKEIGMRDAVVLHGRLQNGLGSFMSDDVVKHV